MSGKLASLAHIWLEPEFNCEAVSLVDEDLTDQSSPTSIQKHLIEFWIWAGDTVPKGASGVELSIANWIAEVDTRWDLVVDKLEPIANLS